MTDDIAKLIARARQSDPEAAFALADLLEHALALPDRRIRAAFRLGRRGGEPQWRAGRRASRDDALRKLAALLYADLPLEQQARAMVERSDRFMANGWEHDQHRPGTSAERMFLRQIGESGLPIPRLRQMKRILGAGMHSPVWTAETQPHG